MTISHKTCESTPELEKRALAALGGLKGVLLACGVTTLVMVVRVVSRFRMLQQTADACHLTWTQIEQVSPWLWKGTPADSLSKCQLLASQLYLEFRTFREVLLWMVPALLASAYAVWRARQVVEMARNAG